MSNHIHTFDWGNAIIEEHCLITYVQCNSCRATYEKNIAEEIDKLQDQVMLLTMETSAVGQIEAAVGDLLDGKASLNLSITDGKLKVTT